LSCIFYIQPIGTEQGKYAYELDSVDQIQRGTSGYTSEPVPSLIGAMKYNRNFIRYQGLEITVPVSILRYVAPQIGSVYLTACYLGLQKP
jgi:hypothetical protein